MKKYILIALVALASTSLHAQETKLTLEAIPGKLAEQLTQEQMETVTELTLTGEMYNCDFYTIRDKMPGLTFLDLKEAMADTIPGKGLEYTNLSKIVLPKNLSVIEDHAFSNSQLNDIIWSRYPENIGDHLFFGCIYLESFSVTEDSENCTSQDGILFSKDFKELLLYPLRILSGNGNIAYVIPEGVEIIKQKAFMDTQIYEITLPESLKKIEDKSFWVEIRIPTGGGYGRESGLYQVICLSPDPPLCEGDPLRLRENIAMPQLTVPAGSEELYQADPYWGEFYRYLSISSLTENSKNIYRVEIIDMNGNILMPHQSKEIWDGHVFLKNLHGCYLIKTYHEDGRITTHKMIN